MAKAKKESYIALETDRYAKKIEEFQAYLENHPIEDVYDDKTRQAEITTQIALMRALGEMLMNLANMREQESAKIETRGNIQLNGMMRKEMEKGL